jgi:membrane-bound serine protease (ClpP class)
MTAQLGSTLVAAFFVAGAVSASVGPGGFVQSPPPPLSHSPSVYVAGVDSIIHPVSAEYMIQTMDLADRAGAALVVFTLETPGGLVDSTRQIVTHMLAAKTPVAIFVAPSGARAASAGFILTIAADVAAMAPGTHIGAAHPVAGGGEQIDETMQTKVTADTAAYARTLAAGRRRNIALAEEAVRESRAFTEQEALGASPPLIDLVAADVPDLLRRLDGRSITRFDGGAVLLETTDAVIVPIGMSLRQRVLSAIAHPNIAFMLLSLGILGLTIELWTPGAVVPGVVGAVSLLVAFFALQLLPVNYAGLLLIVLGVVLLILEIKITSYGLLTVGGLVSLMLGAMILMDAPEPELRLSLRFVVPLVLGFVVIAGFLGRLAVVAQRQRPATGATLLLGAAGEALTPIAPGGTGQVRVRGEIWRAIADDSIAQGARVVVTDLEGLTLTVRQA